MTDKLSGCWHTHGNPTRRAKAYLNDEHARAQISSTSGGNMKALRPGPSSLPGMWCVSRGRDCEQICHISRVCSISPLVGSTPWVAVGATHITKQVVGRRPAASYLAGSPAHGGRHLKKSVKVRKTTPDILLVSFPCHLGSLRVCSPQVLDHCLDRPIEGVQVESIESCLFF